MPNTANIMLGVSFSLLGTELLAFVEADNDGGQHIKIHQDIDVPNEGVAITEIASDVKRLLGTNQDIPGLTETEIKKKISSLQPESKKESINWANLRICLQTVYLDIKKPKAGDSTVDYAFRVLVKADGVLPDIKLIQIHSLSLSIWNTEKPDIKKRLGLLLSADQT